MSQVGRLPHRGRSQRIGFGDVSESDGVGDARGKSRIRRLKSHVDQSSVFDRRNHESAPNLLRGRYSGPGFRSPLEIVAGPTRETGALENGELRRLEVAHPDVLVDYRAIEPEDVRISFDDQPRVGLKYRSGPPVLHEAGEKSGRRESPRSASATS